MGPGIVAGGVGLSSGEFVLWPFIASQVGLVLLWGALVGVVTQFFLNMEVERYTLATGETAVSGFNRLWRHWGLVFAVLAYLGNLWPGWAISAATLASYLFGGNPTLIAVGMLLVVGLSLTFAPVVYVALERLIFVKVAAVLILVAARRQLWRSTPRRGGRWERASPASAPSPTAWGSRWCSAPSRMPVPAARRTCARATGFATRASAWGVTCRVW